MPSTVVYCSALPGLTSVSSILALHKVAAQEYVIASEFATLLTDSIQWNITVPPAPNDTEVIITDMDKVKNLYYDGASVTAQEMPFTWKVWQAAPGTDNFLWVSILANTAIVKGC